MPTDGLTPELRAELSAIVADLETRGALLDAAGRPTIRWRDITGLGLVTPMDVRDGLVTSASTTWTDLPGSDLYGNIVEMWRRMERAETDRRAMFGEWAPHGHSSTWTVVEASAGTLPDGIAMAVLSPMGPACVMDGCKHTHMVLIREPDKPQADEMRQAEVCRRTGVRLWRRWLVVLPDGSTARCFTRWGANRKARRSQ